MPRKITGGAERQLAAALPKVADVQRTPEKSIVEVQQEAKSNFNENLQEANKRKQPVQIRTTIN